MLTEKKVIIVVILNDLIFSLGQLGLINRIDRGRFQPRKKC